MLRRDTPKLLFPSILRVGAHRALSLFQRARLRPLQPLLLLVEQAPLELNREQQRVKLPHEFGAVLKAREFDGAC